MQILKNSKKVILGSQYLLSDKVVALIVLKELVHLDNVWVILNAQINLVKQQASAVAAVLHLRFPLEY